MKKHAWRHLCAAALVAGCLLCCSACKPTDFFTEVVISPFAENIDYNNPNKPLVNSGNAEKESDVLSVLGVSEDAERVEQEENLIVYSSQPNTALTTVHSLYAFKPMLTGVESSDPVKLVLTKQSTETPKETPEDTDKSEKQKKKSSASKQGKKTSKTSKSKGSNKGTSGSKGSGSKGKGSDGSKSGGSGESKTEQGESKQEDGGYDGSDITYDPSNGFAELQKADSIAACGQAAVMVQALGGKGALCAMDEYTYKGYAANGKDASYSGAFSDVFADHLADGFKKNALLWEEDGSSKGDVKDIDALVKACGEGGVILFDSANGRQTDYFTSKQLTAFKNANIQLVPVDLSTVQGIIDCAHAIGDVLSESDAVENDVSSMVDKYEQFIYSMVEAAASCKTDGGTSFARVEESDSKIYTSYDDCPSAGRISSNLYAVIATDFEDGVSYVNEKASVNTEDGILFTRIGYAGSPLSFWAQVAGVVNQGAAVSSSAATSDSLTMVWQHKDDNATAKASNFSGYSSSGPFSQLPSDVKKKGAGDLLIGRTLDVGTASTSFGYGLGSEDMPYLIVSATQKKTAEQVESAVQKSMKAENSTYSAYPWLAEANAPGLLLSKGSATVKLTGSIGSTNDPSAGSVFHDGGVSVDDTVRANPCGLLGSWTDGTMESVLETAWLTDVYSEAPEGSTYQPVTTQFQVNLEGETYDFQGACDYFYQTFYGMDSSPFSSVVSDWML